MKIVSIDGHPRQEELADYVSDTLDPAQALRVETHVFDCEPCATRLQDAAAFQMLLHDAAHQMDAEIVPVVTPKRRRRSWRVGAVGGMWAAAAGLVLMMCQQVGSVDIDPGAPPLFAAATEASPNAASFVDGEPVGSDGVLLASLDPLESVDPLQTWPDDPFTGADWTDDEVLDGEPCGSGEDGGPLVCQPFSG